MLEERLIKRGLLFFCVMVVLAGVAQTALSKDRGVAGTYELLICKGECSFAERANVVRTAVIVLFDRAMKRQDFAQLDPTYDFRRDKANACYTLAYPNRQASSITAWKLDRRTFALTLVHSPDSRYSVRV